MLKAETKAKINSDWLNKINMFFKEFGEKFSNFVINILKKILSNF